MRRWIGCDGGGVGRRAVLEEGKEEEKENTESIDLDLAPDPIPIGGYKY